MITPTRAARVALRVCGPPGAMPRRRRAKNEVIRREAGEAGAAAAKAAAEAPSSTAASKRDVGSAAQAVRSRARDATPRNDSAPSTVELLLSIAHVGVACLLARAALASWTAAAEDLPQPWGATTLLRHAVGAGFPAAEEGVPGSALTGALKMFWGVLYGVPAVLSILGAWTTLAKPQSIDREQAIQLVNQDGGSEVPPYAAPAWVRRGYLLVSVIHAVLLAALAPAAAVASDAVLRHTLGDQVPTGLATRHDVLRSVYAVPEGRSLLVELAVAGWFAVHTVVWEMGPVSEMMSVASARVRHDFDGDDRAPAASALAEGAIERARRPWAIAAVVVGLLAVASTATLNDF